MDSLLALFNNSNFSDRIKTASDARASAVERLKARPAADDPRLLAKAAERKAFHDARLARQAEKDRLSQEQAERDAEARRLHEEEEFAKALVLEAEVEANRKAAEVAKLERATRVLSSLADQKATRDARYAARKSRQKQGR